MAKALQERPNNGESNAGVFFCQTSRNRGMATGILKLPWENSRGHTAVPTS